MKKTGSMVNIFDRDAEMHEARKFALGGKLSRSVSKVGSA